jgi:hypothetical protein
VADANTVIKALGMQLAQAIIDKTIAEVDAAELRDREAARADIEAGRAAVVAELDQTG